MPADVQRARLRAVLHHQGARARHRPRPVDGLRHRQAERRLHLGGLGGRAAAPASASICRAMRRRRRLRAAPAAPHAARAAGQRDAARRRGRGRRPRADAGLARVARLPRADRRQRRRGARRRAPRYDEPIDLVVADMVMPAMGGPALVQHARSRRGPELKVMYMSGYADATPGRPRRARRADAVPAEALRPRHARRRRSAKCSIAARRRETAAGCNSRGLRVPSAPGACVRPVRSGPVRVARGRLGPASRRLWPRSRGLRARTLPSSESCLRDVEEAGRA